MKKVFVLIMVLIMAMGIVGCSEQPTYKEPSEKPKEEIPAPTVPQKDEGLSEEMIILLTERALYNEIASTYTNADPGSTRYSINKIEEGYREIYVYGTLSMYDKYGQLTTGWIDNSGSYFRTFTVTIENDGEASAEID